MSKHTKHHSPHGEVGNFFHLTVKVFRDLERQSGVWNTILLISSKVLNQIKRE